MSKKAYINWKQIQAAQAKLKASVEADPWRLSYHQMPETGWLNDPNGAVQFDGVYHLYHQYVPQDPKGGATHWGHKTSTDMVHFKDEEIFMSPDQAFDQDGVYSGSAIVLDDKIHFFYTGNVKNEGDHDYTFSGREQHTVHVVSPDGFTIESREVIIPHSAYPEGFTDHIRDPKVFELNGKYYLILGARRRTNVGSILIYSSTNLYDWEYEGVFLEGDEEQGYMWECPDYFNVSGKDIAIFSPQGILPTTYNYHNPHAATYLTGQVNWEELKFQVEEDFRELDHGFDFYAPQTFEDDQGRRIMWVWMGIGDTQPEYNNPTIARGWQHAMALPRELSFEDGMLKQRPLVEYQTLRGQEQSYSLTELSADTLRGEVYELLIKFDEGPKDFELLLRQDTSVTYQNGELTLRHGESGYGRRKRTLPLESLSQLHIFSDTSSLEIFVNDGEAVFTSRVYPDANQDKIQITGNGTGKVTYWDLARTTK